MIFVWEKSAWKSARNNLRTVFCLSRMSRVYWEEFVKSAITAIVVAGHNVIAIEEFCQLLSKAHDDGGDDVQQSGNNSGNNTVLWSIVP